MNYQEEHFTDNDIYLLYGEHDYIERKETY